MNVDFQKEVAKEVLESIRALDDRAIIAGGAPRDWYFNKLANDIDIFYYFDTNTNCLNDIRKQKNILKKLLGIDEINVLGFNPEIHDHEKQPKDDFSNYLKNPDIKNVYEAEIKGVKFQFISLVSRNVNVSKFAYNMCQAWSDGETVYTSRKFDLGVSKKILMETGELYSNTEKFKQKMIAKFPDYDYIEK